MVERSTTRTNRRTYLKVVGTGTVLGLAGCTGGSGDGGDGDGDEGEDGGTTTTENPTIVAGTASGFAPFEIVEGGELTGFDIDLLEAVVEETDYTLENWEDLNSFDSLIPALRNNNIDVIAAAMTITDDRDQSIDFTDPYYSANQSVVVREGGDFQPASKADLSGHRVGAQKGTTGEGEAQDAVSSGNYRAYDSYVLAIQDLENGNIDAVVIDQPVGETFAANRDVSVAFTIETGENYGFGVRTNDDELQSALNEGLTAVRDSGQYQEITQTWFGQ